MKFRHFLYLAAVGLLLSCKGEEKPEAAAIAFAQNPMFVSCESGVQDCGLICNASWEASSKDAWVTVLTPEGKAGEALKIRVSSNTGDADRTASLKVMAGSSGKVLQIVQYGNVASGFVSETKVSLDTYGTLTYITVTCDGGWSFEAPEATWLKPEKKNAAVLNITADINFTGAERTGTFKILSDDGSKEAEITVIQQFSNEKFLASTPYGRELVYAMGSYVQSVTKDSYTEVTDGVHSFEMTATWQDSFGGDTAPLVRNMYLFEVDMTKATIVATMTDDKDENIHSVQRMTAQAAALQTSRPEITVYGAVNGDFFYNDNGVNTLQGVLHRRGTVLKDSFHNGVCTVFAVLKDGTARCLSQAEYASLKGQIREAIGGRQVLISDNNKVNFTDTAQHPRTAVGVSSDGKTAWLLIVDGRDELYKTGSFSVSYDPLARILKAAGAYDAINLDGGGSSTYIVRNSAGTLQMRNAPGNSNLVERAVIDGLAIIR